MANQFLGLSLFIMLLSFFIILNSMSNFEDVKSLPVLNSLSVAFSKKEIKQVEPPGIQQDVIQQAFRDGDTLTKLEALFRSKISGVDINKNRLGTVMHIRVSVERFEKEIMRSAPVGSDGVLGGAGGDFAGALASVLQASQSEIPYRLDMVLNASKNPPLLQHENPEEMRKKIKKVSSFAQRLEATGLPKKYISSGVGEGKVGTIDLFFRRYAPFDPVGDTQEPSAGAPSNG